MVYLSLKYDTKNEYDKKITLGELCIGVFLGVFIAPVLTVVIPYIFIQDHKEVVIFKWGQEDKEE
jgi:Mg/Co/Ni transporter MgtE